jgi:hypothetical protein
MAVLSKRSSSGGSVTTSVLQLLPLQLLVGTSNNSTMTKTASNMIATIQSQETLLLLLLLRVCKL